MTLPKYTKVTVIVLMGLLVFMVWYKYKFSMDYVDTQEIHNPAEYANHVLIATQGSEFKDAILEEIVNELTVMEYYIKVIDVSHLETVRYSDWNAVCLIHTWEQWRAPRSVEKFIDGLPNKDKLIVLTTSGSGTGQMDRIDGITSASVLTDVNKISGNLVEQIIGVVQVTAMAN